MNDNLSRPSPIEILLVEDNPEIETGVRYRLSPENLVAKDDIIIIISYAMMDFEEAKDFKPSIVFPNEEDNSLT